jgi:hypothetical protein
MTLTIVVLALSPFFGLVMCMVSHVLVSRLRPALPRHHGIALSVLGGGSLVVLLLAGAWPEPAMRAAGPSGLSLTWVLTYLLLAYCYVIGFFNLGESARRIRLLIELHGAGSRGLTREEILASYNARMIVEVRLLRLVSGGQIVERLGRYVIRRGLMLRAAKLLALLKLILLGARNESDFRR